MRKIVLGLALYLMAMVPQFVYSKNPAQALSVYSVGDVAQGGVIFWLDPSRQHGLVCSLEDLSASAAWMLAPAATVSLGAYANGTWMGGPNTQVVVDFIEEFSIAGTFASKVCFEYRGGGYSDWYLPSALEMALLYDMTSFVNPVIVAHGGTAIALLDPYWTSTEVSGSNAYAESYQEAPVSTVKTTLYRARAIRAF